MSDRERAESPEAELPEADIAHLRRALRLAARGRATVSPNPMVGCVLVAPDGRRVGEGWHERAGEAHAEIHALRHAGSAARGATAYVTLEPCDHQGRTGPCSQALIDAGVARVVACHRDPNPRVDGGGFARLRSAGVEVVSGVLVEPAVRLNWRFLVALTAHRPAISLKWAMSLDGRIATAGGDSQWISGPSGRRWALDQRETHDAILVGSGTALLDDPRLDRRRGRAEGPIVRVVLDRRLRLDPAARMFDIDGPILVYTLGSALGSSPERAVALAERGAELVPLDPPASVHGAGADAPHELATLCADLDRRGIRSILVEGGGTVAASFAEAGLFDRVAVCCAPLLIGGAAALGPLGGLGFQPLSRAPRLEGLEVGRRGDDLILTAFRDGCLRDLCTSVGG